MPVPANIAAPEILPASMVRLRTYLFRRFDAAVPDSQNTSGIHSWNRRYRLADIAQHNVVVAIDVVRRQVYFLSIDIDTVGAALRSDPCSQNG